MLQQQTLQDSEALQREHVTEDEARAVVELWAEQQKERERLASMPTVQDMAEGLQIPPDEAHRLLAEVRARRWQQQQAQSTAGNQQSTLGQRTMAKPAARIIAFVVAMLVALSLLWLIRSAGPVSPPTVATEQPAPVEEHTTVVVPAPTPPAPTPDAAAPNSGSANSAR